MRVGFAGTPEFAATALAAIADAGFELPLVLTQPDRPAGRGMKATPSAVKRLALARGLPMAQPAGLRRDGRHAADAAEAAARIALARLDVLVVAAYGLILPRWVLDAPTFGCVNIHASLLPRWRGAAPVQRAIEAGDTVTGVTLMQMDEGLDTGAMIVTGELAIGAGDTTATLLPRLAGLGADLVVPTLRAGRWTSRPQPEEGVTYAAKIEKHEAAIDWRLPAAAIERRVRAFDPFPGASFVLDGETVKVWRCRAGVAVGGAPGEVVDVDDGALSIACGSGCLQLLEIQRPGGRRVPAAALIAARPGLAGRRLAVPHDRPPDAGSGAVGGSSVRPPGR